jgi:predicted acyl esterase
VLAGREPDLPRVRAYVLGARRWLDLDAWPPPGTESLAVALEPGKFAVDPAAQVPALGGRGLLVNTPGWGHGIADQRPLLGRDDVHLALRETISSDVLLAGPITAEVSIAAVGGGDADALWVATLCVQQSDGALDNLSEGVAVARATADRVSIELGHTCAWLPAASTLVLLVAGSSFPRWPRPATRRTQRILAGSQLRLTTAPRLGHSSDDASTRPSS